MELLCVIYVLSTKPAVLKLSIWCKTIKSFDYLNFEFKKPKPCISFVGCAEQSRPSGFKTLNPELKAWSV